MISRFFIDRPIFASVISIIIVLMGFVSLRILPIEQYPNITPPLVVVSATYTGADAKTVAENVAAPIEQQVNGVDNMIYMYSQNSSNGAMNLNVYFDIGTDPDMAQVNVQNRVNIAFPTLPQEVQRNGVTVQKQSPSILMVIALRSPDERYDNIYLSNYATINVIDELLRVEGISQATNFGARDYSMRIWLRPDRMAELGLSATEIITAVREQNQQFAIGQIGLPPTSEPVEMTLPISAKGRLTTPEEFGNIVIRAYDNGSMLLLKDIAKVELAAVNYDLRGTLNNESAILIGVYQQYGANALDVADRVKASMERMSENFPIGIEYSIPYDTTKFIKRSIIEVAQTVFEAAILVVLVVLIFLQNFRVTLIPLLAMLVSIIGTFAGMYVLGFSINTLTLFGMVLAIGIVVDDAIVVVENVERNMREHGLEAREAAKRAMDEVTGPVIAIVFVLCAVFLPVAFLGGIAGQLYKQFAITITISVVISGIVALTLSPAIAAVILKPVTKRNRLANGFNYLFEKLTQTYVAGASFIIHRSILGLAIFAIVLGLVYFMYNLVPTSFVPNEDQGYLIAATIMPDGSSLDRTAQVDRRLGEIALEDQGVEDVVNFSGFSLLDGLNRYTAGTTFITLTDWDKRTTPNLFADAILKRLSEQFTAIKEGLVMAFNPPAIQGLGTVGGFEFWIENRGGGDMQVLQQITNDFLAKAAQRPELQGLSTSIQANNMQLYIDLDRFKARTLGVAISDVFETLQALIGSLYVNDFNKFGRVYHVMMQADPDYRSTVGDLGEVYVRSATRNMVPLNSIVTTKYTNGPTLISRFNGFNASKIIGSAAPGYSSGQAMKAMQEVAKEVLPSDMHYSWAGESYQEMKTGGTSLSILLGGMVMVFLILSALYERWSLPFAIILAVPFGILGALIAVWLRGLSNDVYFQVGLVTLIALSAKNAILIVEFAVIKHEEGLPIIEAALEAARLRFRAILMTSLTFIFGVIPLVISTGAGAASRHSVGTGVMGGMISATIFAIFFVPLFYKLVQFRLRKEKHTNAQIESK